MSYSTGLMAWRSVFRVSPMFALLWEQGRIIRGPIASASVIAVIIIPLLAYLGSATRMGDLADLFANTILAFCVLYATVFAVFRRRPDEEIRSGFPYPVNTLPIRRPVLVFTVLLFRLCAVGLCALALGTMENLAFYPKHPCSTYAVAAVSVCFAAYAMAISWTLGQHGTGISFLALVGFSVPILVASLTAITDSKVSLYPLVVTLTALFSAIAVWGAHREKRAWPSLGSITSALARMLLPRRFKGRFQTRDAAQFWFEWRTRGIVLPICAFCIAILPPLLIGAMRIGIALLENKTAGLAGGANFATALICDWMPGAMLFAGAFTGFIFVCLDQRTYEAKRAGRVESVPLSSSMLAVSRFTVSLYATVLSCAAAFLVFACALAYLKLGAHQGTLFDQILAHRFALLIVPVIVVAYTGAIWCLVWSPFTIFAVAAWAYLVLMPIAVAYEMLGFGKDITQHEAFRFASFGVPSAVAIVCALNLGLRCYRRALLPPRVVKRAAAASVATLVALSVAPLCLFEKSLFSQDVSIAVNYFFFITAVATIPALAVFSQGMWVRRLRYLK